MRIGIDEAGRGCLIGPMVVAGVALTEVALERLKKSGVKDSKKLTRKERERLFELIVSESEGVAIAKALPEEIDAENLNRLTYSKVIEIIDALSWVNPEVVTVDKVGRETEVIQTIRKHGFSPNVVHKADELFVEASSASIVAKVIRDRIIDSLKKDFGDFGSGYPSDRKTVQWLLNLVSRGDEPPNIIRRSWKLLLKYAPEFYVDKVS